MRLSSNSGRTFTSYRQSIAHFCVQTHILCIIWSWPRFPPKGKQRKNCPAFVRKTRSFQFTKIWCISLASTLLFATLAKVFPRDNKFATEQPSNVSGQKSMKTKWEEEMEHLIGKSTDLGSRMRCHRQSLWPRTRHVKALHPFLLFKSRKEYKGSNHTGPTWCTEGLRRTE